MSTAPETTRLLTWDDLAFRGNTTNNQIYYDTKVRETGPWLRVTRHKAIQSKTLVPQARTRRKINKQLLQLKISHFSPEQYVDYLFNKHIQILRNHEKKVDKLIDTIRSNVIPKKNRTSFGTIFMRVSFADEHYPKSRKDAFRKLEYCKKKAEKWLGMKLQATYVLEKATDPRYTKRWHFHVIIYNAPFASFEQWQEKAFIYGTVNVQSVHDTTGLGKYVTKMGRYIEKEQHDLPKYARTYNSTIGLKKPIDHYHVADAVPVMVRYIKHGGILVNRSKWLPNTYYEKDELQYELWQYSP